MTREQAHILDMYSPERGNDGVVSKRSVYSLIECIFDDFESRTCENCKHWHSKRVDHPNYRECNNEDAYGVFLNDTNYKFGCNKFERKQ